MKIIKTYLPDVLIIGGITFASYWFLTPTKIVSSLPRPPSIGYTDYHTDLKVLGIFIFLVGVDIAVRRIYKSMKQIEK